MTAPISNGPTTHGYTTMRDTTNYVRNYWGKALTSPNAADVEVARRSASLDAARVGKTFFAQQRSHRRGGQRTLGRPRTHKCRMQFPQCKNQRRPKNRRISTIRLQDLKYSPGNCMRNCKAPSDWRAPEGPDAAPVDGSGTWPGFETTRRTATRHHWCGGRQRDLPRCRWAVAGPGRASRRRAKPHISDPAPLV